MRRNLVIAIVIAGMSGLVYAADDRPSSQDGFVSSAISDVFDKIGKVTSGEEPIIESVDDYDMDSSGRRIPKRRVGTNKQSSLEEKLSE